MGKFHVIFNFLTFSVFPTDFLPTLRQHCQILRNYQFFNILNISNRFLANIMPTLANYMFFPHFQFFHIFTSDFFSLVIDELYSITSRHINRMTFPLKMTITYNYYLNISASKSLQSLESYVYKMGRRLK